MSYKELNKKLIRLEREIRELRYTGGLEWLRLQTEILNVTLDMAAIKQEFRRNYE